MSISIYVGDVSKAVVAPLLLGFWRFFLAHAGPSARASLSVRDLLSWVHFINATAPEIGELPAYAHGAHLTLLDGIALVSGVPAAAAAALRSRCHAHLLEQLSSVATTTTGSTDVARLHAELAAGELARAVPELISRGLMASEPPTGRWGLPPFYIPRSMPATGVGKGGFELKAPTTARNAFRILRALQVGSEEISWSPPDGRVYRVNFLGVGLRGWSFPKDFF